MRNFIEAFIWGALLYFIIWETGFLFKVKMVFFACIAGPIIILNIYGIKNLSVSLFLFRYLRFKRSTISYHLRSVADAKKESKQSIFAKVENIANSAEDGTSIAQKYFGIAKEAYKQRKQEQHNNATEVHEKLDIQSKENKSAFCVAKERIVEKINRSKK